VQTPEEVANCIMDCVSNDKADVRIQTNPSIDRIFKVCLNDVTGNQATELVKQTFFAKKDTETETENKEKEKEKEMNE